MQRQRRRYARGRPTRGSTYAVAIPNRRSLYVVLGADARRELRLSLPSAQPRPECYQSLESLPHSAQAQPLESSPLDASALVIPPSAQPQPMESSPSNSFPHSAQIPLDASVATAPPSTPPSAQRQTGDYQPLSSSPSGYPRMNTLPVSFPSSVQAQPLESSPPTTPPSAQPRPDASAPTTLYPGQLQLINYYLLGTTPPSAQPQPMSFESSPASNTTVFDNFSWDLTPSNNLPRMF